MKRTFPLAQFRFAAASGVIATIAVYVLIVAQERVHPASLFNWNEIGASLDSSVPLAVSHSAANVGGMLVREHGPSGKLPGFGGGSHLFDDGVVDLKRDMRHDLGIRRSARERARAMLRRQQRARSLERARDVLRRQRYLEQRSPVVPLQELRRVTRVAQPARISEATIEAAYKRAAHLARERTAVSSRSITGAYKNAARLAESAAADAEAPANSPKGAVGGNTAAILSKAANALQTITKSLDEGSFEPDADRMAKMASSLASLSHALGQGKGGTSQTPLQMPTSSSSSAKQDFRSSRNSSSPGKAAARHAREVQAREEKIEEDILYHLDKLKLLPASHVSARAARATNSRDVEALVKSVVQQHSKRGT
jgi:hypothetical protein